MTNETTAYEIDELRDALAYAVSLIDQISTKCDGELKELAITNDGSLPDNAAQSAKMLNAAFLRSLKAFAQQNGALLGDVAEQKPKTAWYDPVAEIRARLARTNS